MEEEKTILKDKNPYCPDIATVVKTIRAASPDCIIILDGIQHAAHGGLSIDEYHIDGYDLMP